jgi:hypothetical protein
LSSGKASFDIVPPFDVIAFAHLPAEQNDTPIAQGRKVNQAASVIFKLHAQGIKLARVCQEFDEKRYIAWAVRHSASALFRTFGCVLGGRLEEKNSAMSTLNTQQNAAYRREQRIRLFNAKNFHKNRIQNPEVRSQKKRKSERRLQPLILASGF